MVHEHLLQVSLAGGGVFLTRPVSYDSSPLVQVTALQHGAESVGHVLSGGAQGPLQSGSGRPQFVFQHAQVTEGDWQFL